MDNTVVKGIFCVLYVSSLVWSSGAYAEIYRCTNSLGKLNFSDKPCGDSAEVITLKAGSTYTKTDDSEQWESIKLSNSTRKLGHL